MYIVYIYMCVCNYVFVYSVNLVLYEIAVCLADASSGIRIPAVGTPEPPSSHVAFKEANHLPPQV